MHGLNAMHDHGLMVYVRTASMRQRSDRPHLLAPCDTGMVIYTLWEASLRKCGEGRNMRKTTQRACMKAGQR